MLILKNFKYYERIKIKAEFIGNIINGKIYIDNSSNLKVRLKNYYNISFLEAEIKKIKSKIYRALLKYGYSKFTLEILEYCDLLSPSYGGAI